MKYAYDDLSIGLQKLGTFKLTVPNIIERPSSLPLEDWRKFAEKVCYVMNEIDKDYKEALLQLSTMRSR